MSNTGYQQSKSESVVSIKTSKTPWNPEMFQGMESTIPVHWPQDQKSDVNDKKNTTTV